MPHEARKVSQSGYYHVIARGINRENTFNQMREKNYLKKILMKHLPKYKVEIYAYCIMSNHVHLIIKADIEELSMFMSRILAEYAEYYNYKHNRNGHVFQNRFKSECIENEIYFWTCLRYIHLNPIKAHMVKNPLDYEHSSMGEYINRKSRILHENAWKMCDSKYENTVAFVDYHRGACCRVFLDIPVEIFCQFKEISMIVLNQLQMQYQLKNPIEILESKELRQAYKNELQSVLSLSKNKAEMLCLEIKKIIQEK
ncbi:MAG: transposase [Lachnospiraceae bacterium]